MCSEKCELKAREKIEAWWSALQKLASDHGGYHVFAKALNEPDIQTPDQRWDKFGSLMIEKIHKKHPELNTHQ